MDLEAELDRLFQLPLAEYTEARNALAARLRSDDAGAAARVKSLAKPAASAWAVNQLCLRQPQALGNLVAAGERLRAAQQGARTASELREATRVWREALTAAVKEAARFLAKGKPAASPDTLRRIEGTLQALALRAGDTEPRPGRLTADLEPPGFDVTFESLAPPQAAAVTTADVPDASRHLEAARAGVEAAERRLETAQADLAEAERQIEQARDLVARAEEGLVLARSRRDETRTAVAEAEAALSAARRRLG